MASRAAVESVAGGIGSLIALVTTYPLKTSHPAAGGLQGPQPVSCREAGAGAQPVKLLQSLLPSIGALYSGLQPAAIETTASNAIYFYFYSLLRAGVVSNFRARRGLPRVSAGSAEARSEDIGVAASLLVAAVAGAINMVVCTQMQARANMKRQLAAQGQAGAGQAIRSDAMGVVGSIWQEDGALGFWKGLAPNLILVVNPAVQYMAYEWLTQRHKVLKQKRLARMGVAAGRVKLSAGEVFVLGASAKVAATIVTYPMIVIKSRLQAAGSHTAADLQYAGTWDAIRRIWAEEGPGGYFKGMRAKILQTALNAALMLMVKEQVHGSAAATVRAVESLVGSLQPLPPRVTSNLVKAA
ncbi:mitochondrial carrier domain-containing protein [Scenedesmus sp. NREL 46B-D3]|nr:mitochondrial carrier domain-containing protein [Scenedesmus sp. NREL 46B-D3]